MDDNYLQHNTTPGIVSTVKPPYLLGFIFRNVPITVFVVQSEPNNYLVLIQRNQHYAFNQPEHKVQRLILQVQTGRISSQDQEAHRKLLEVDSTILRVCTSSEIFIFTFLDSNINVGNIHIFLENMKVSFTVFLG